MAPRRFIAAMILVLFVGAGIASADSITMNLDPVGTTSNLNIFGTTLTGGSATWPARNTLSFRDYQFELLTASGSTTFDTFSVKLSAQLRQSTATENTLRASLWAGPMVDNPLLADAIVTVTTPNSSFVNGASGYSSVTLSGASFTPQVITTAPSTFFFRVWAEGGNSNAGFMSKMASTLGEFQAVTMSPAPGMDGYMEFDTNNDGFIDSGEEVSTRDLIQEVPEPAAFLLAVVGAGVACLRVWQRRRVSR